MGIDSPDANRIRVGVLGRSVDTPLDPATLPENFTTTGLASNQNGLSTSITERIINRVLNSFDTRITNAVGGTGAFDNRFSGVVGDEAGADQVAFDGIGKNLIQAVHDLTTSGGGGTSMPEPPADDKLYGRKREPGEAAGEWHEVVADGGGGLDEAAVIGIMNNNFQNSASIEKRAVPGATAAEQTLNLRRWEDADQPTEPAVVVRPGPDQAPEYHPLTVFAEWERGVMQPQTMAFFNPNNNRLWATPFTWQQVSAAIQTSERAIAEVEDDGVLYGRIRNPSAGGGWWRAIPQGARAMLSGPWTHNLDAYIQAGFYDSGDYAPPHSQPRFDNLPPRFAHWGGPVPGTYAYVTRFVMLVEAGVDPNTIMIDDGTGTGTEISVTKKVKQTVTATMQDHPAGPAAGTTYTRTCWHGQWSEWVPLDNPTVIPEGSDLNNYTTAGEYWCNEQLVGTGSEISHAPPGVSFGGQPGRTRYFLLHVESSGTQPSNEQRWTKQTLTSFPTGTIPGPDSSGHVATTINTWERFFRNTNNGKYLPQGEWSAWQSVSLPSGGQPYQVLGKASAGDGDVAWQWPGTRGGSNVMIGANALRHSPGYANTAIGNEALTTLTNGTYNTAVGAYALQNTGNGHYNTALGTYALQNYAGDCCVAVGYRALRYLTDAWGYSNTAVGYNAGSHIDNGTRNTAVGYNALAATTYGENNTAVGNEALTANISGTYNVAIGNRALRGNITGNRNTALGTYALSNNTGGQSNVAVGGYALTSNTTGYLNTAIGTEALQANKTGYDNTAVGTYALHSDVGGYRNTAVGYNALGTNSGGYENTAVGYNALARNTTGTLNVAIGAHAGTGFDGALNQSGHNNIFIGYGTRPAANNESNQVVIGNGTTGGGPNSVTIGNAYSTGTHRTQVAWTVGISDVRGKEDIEPADLDRCIEALKQLPVSRWKWRDFLARPNQHEIGWIADDVEKIFPKSISITDEHYQDHTIKDCKHHNVHHEALPTLWAATQRLLQRIEELETEVRSFRKGTGHD